jgi:hypothetical protein
MQVDSELLPARELELGVGARNMTIESAIPAATGKSTQGRLTFSAKSNDNKGARPQIARILFCLDKHELLHRDRT